MAGSEVKIIHGTSCEKVLSVLLNFRQTKKFCDITLVSGERSFYAHSCVLAAVSPYFMALLRSGMSEVKTNFLKIDVAFLSVSSSAVNSVLDFVYGKDIEVNSDNVFDLLALADYLLLTDLKANLCEYLCTNMSIGNPSSCLQTWRFAEMFACKALYEFTDCFLKTRFYQLSKTDEFNEFTLSEFEGLLESDELAANDYEVFTSIIKWVNHSPESRQEYMDQLLEYVDVDCLPQPDVNDLLVANNMDQLPCFVKTDNDEEGASSNTVVEDGHPGQEVVLALGEKTSMCYVAVSKEWCTIETVPGFRKRFTAALLDGLVYVIGGIVNERLSLSVYVYNPESGVWKQVAPMLKIASSFGVASVGGHLYAVGGPKLECSVQRYDPNANAWSFVKPMQIQRDEHCVVAFQEKYLFVIGGLTPDTSSLYSVERYDIHTDTWTTMAKLNVGRIESSAVALGDKIFVTGGYGGARHPELRSCEVYDSLINEWCIIASTIAPRRGAGIAVVGGKIHLFGGCSAKKSCCEYFCEKSKSWVKVGTERGFDQGIQCCTVILSGQAICRNLANKC